MRKLLVFDLDGVLAKLTLGLTSLGHDMFGTQIVEDDDQPDWNFDNVMTNEQQTKVWAHIKAHPEFWGTLEPALSAYYDLEDMRHYAAPFSGFEVAYLTNRRGKGVSEVTKAWLWQYGFPYGEVACVSDKVKWLQDRRRAGRELAGVLEDAPHNLLAMWEANLPAWCFSRQYNLDLVGPRVSSVGEFLYRVSKQVPYQAAEEEMAEVGL